jgi:cobalamin-dependent methionine synthase I
MKLTYSISELSPYINWPYFYFAWQVHDPSEKSRLRHEAESLLSTLEGKYSAFALFDLFPAHSSGDDIVISSPPKLGGARGGLKNGFSRRIPCLRQQQGPPPYLCLSDFLAPLSPLPSEGQGEVIGIFATSVSPSLESDFDSDPYMKMMTQLLADRLAEAAAERMHEQVRKDFWGYAKDEDLSIPDMLVEKFQGIRPAVGYPSLPDTSLNFIINDLIDMSQIGIRLTESGAMKPHASVSGLMLAHPEARYFSIGKIGEDQLRDYASRRGLPLELIRRFLASNL